MTYGKDDYVAGGGLGVRCRWLVRAGLVDGEEKGNGHNQPKEQKDLSGDDPSFTPMGEPGETRPEALRPLLHFHPDLLSPFEGIQEEAHSIFPPLSLEMAFITRT